MYCSYVHACKHVTYAIFLADRLRTIISYDRICVLDAGQITVSLQKKLCYAMLRVCMQEFDTPERLYDKPNGIFRGMCQQSSITLDDIKNGSKPRQSEFESVMTCTEYLSVELL